MGNNVRLVSDVIDYYDILNKSGILLAIDFRKAFDSIEWNFIYKSLESLNFGPSFINWIKAIYNSPEACIKNKDIYLRYFRCLVASVRDAGYLLYFS